MAMNSGLHLNLNQYLGAVFYWNYQPQSYWHVQGILAVNSKCPKVFVVSTDRSRQSAIVPGGLFHDSVEHGLLRISDRLPPSQLPPLKDLSELCKAH